jgi:hypothetical protein
VKERLVTLALAACALALFWLLMFPKPQTAPTTAPRPLASGVDAEGYSAAARWLAAAGVPTVELHQRFDQLGDTTISPRRTGNLLITTLPFGVALNPQEYSDLDRWIDKGNTVLVLAGLDDTPLWSALSTNFVPELQKIARIQFSAVQAPTPKFMANARAGMISVLTPEGAGVALRPSGQIGLLAGVSRLATLSPLPSQQWQAKAMDAAPVLELARRTDSADPVLWIKNSGNGVLIVSAYASLVSNQAIGKMDNARLLSNIVAWSLEPGGRVIFDDGHQGAMQEYDAKKFFADPRLHHSLLWLVALWLAWVVASQPLRASATNVPSMDESAMLRTTAAFFAGVLRPVASAQWLLDEFFDRLRRRHGLAHCGDPPWDWLAAHAGVSSGLLAELRDLYARTQAGHRVSLVRLQQILSQISGHTS